MGWICALGAIGLWAGCASSVPQERLQSAAAAIRAAEEVGADRQPQAALHLQLAKEQMSQANRLIEAGNGDEAGAAASARGIGRQPGGGAGA